VRGAVRDRHGWPAFRAAAKKERNRSDYEGATVPLESASARSVRQTCPPSRRRIARFRVRDARALGALAAPPGCTRWRHPLCASVARLARVERSSARQALATRQASILNKSAMCRGDLTAPAQYPNRGNRAKSGAGNLAEKAAHCGAAQRPSADTASASASCRLFPAACLPLTDCTANKRS
jgi:hypothetical protein